MKVKINICLTLCWWFELLAHPSSGG